ncbi:MAG TPA: mechanosensitive ion channel domain-containing protein [Actinomycetes bacterium]|nr:mechanosensitive ion channel domain-containing protein [Actinomycetes bacterium]
MTFLTDRVLPAAAVLAVGVVLAVVARVVVARLLARLLPGDPDRSRRQVQGAARGAMWFLIVVAVIVASSLLAPQLLADIPAQVLRFLPRLGVALVILWVGAVVANLLRQVVEASLASIQVARAGVIGRITYWVVLGLAILMAADQLGVQTRVVQTVLFLLLLVAGVAVALAVGLGGRALAGNVIAGRYVDDRFTVGERIEVEDWKGTIVEVGLASVTISDGQGELVELPHGYLLTRPVRRSST